MLKACEGYASVRVKGAADHALPGLQGGRHGETGVQKLEIVQQCSVAINMWMCGGIEVGMSRGSQGARVCRGQDRECVDSEA